MNRSVPSNVGDAKRVRHLASKFIMLNEILYKTSFVNPLPYMMGATEGIKELNTFQASHNVPSSISLIEH